MLVLTRKVDQPVLINDNIEIRVLEIRGNRVRLGIVAPPEVSIKRRETLDQALIDAHIQQDGTEVSFELIQG